MCIFTHDSLSQSVFIYTEYHNSLVRNHSAFTPAYEAHIENVLCMTIEFFYLKPVNEFSKFNEFLLDTCRTIATDVQM